MDCFTFHEYSNKYINSRNYEMNFERISYFFLICYYILPQYFGVSLPGFDLTAQRLAMLIVLIYILSSRIRVRIFFDIIVEHQLLMPMLLYLFIILYTAVYRVNVGTFMYSFIEFINIFILMYIIRDILDLKKFIKLLRAFMFVLCIEGLVEYVLGFSLFSKLETIKGLYSGGMIRSGSYRIMGPANHSLGYGLMLITATPFVCIDFDNDRINILQNKVLFILIIINVFLTGSRSSLAVFLLEVLLLFIFSSKEIRKRTFLITLISIFALSILVVSFYGSGFSNYILLQITSIIDEMFDTNLSVNYGASVTTLKNSSIYRSFLPEIFTHKSLNPLVGRGSGYHFAWFHNGYLIRSIDNFYVATYIRYAYPGLVAYCLYILSALFLMIKSWIKHKSGVAGGLFIGALCYFINLWWLDTLQTIKYVYIIFAFFFVYNNIYLKNKETDKGKKSSYNTKSYSKYIKTKYN